MGFFKSLFGGGSKLKSASKPASIPRSLRDIQRERQEDEKRSRNKSGWEGPTIDRPLFTPVSDDATFDIVKPNEGVTDATFETLEDVGERSVRESGATEDEEAYLLGEVIQVASSNVSWIQYLWKYPGPNGEPLAGPDQNEMFIGFHDGSVYQYEQIDFDLALTMYRSGSKGKAVWDNLRVRGTVFGYQKPYRLVSGNRLWDKTEASRARHEAVGKEGEPFASFHPLYNYEGAPGRMGAKGINLGKKGSKKVAYFTPVKAKTDHVPRPKKP